MPLNLISELLQAMAVSMKQLKKALKEVEAEKQPAPGQGKNRKRNAKRKAKRRQNALSSGVPGTWPTPTASTSLTSQWVMSHREYLTQITMPASGDLQGSIFLSPFSFPWLAKLGACFEKYRWISLVLEYIPDVGTTTDGSIALGMDWGTQSNSSLCSALGWETMARDEAYDRAEILALTPSQVTPLWKPARFGLPVAQLQSRRWYTVPTAAVASSVDDFGPGFLAYYCSGASAKKVVGDVWVSYRVEFAGTRKP